MSTEELNEEVIEEVVETEAKKSPKALIIAVISIFVVAIAGILIWLGIQNGGAHAKTKVLGKYDEFTYSKFVIKEIKDSQIDSEYENAIVAYKSMGYKAYKEMENPKSDTVQNGDVVYIDYAGYRDGEAFDGGTGDVYLPIGSGKFIPGFETGLIGKKVGEKVELNLTFPESYGEASLAGKDVIFKVEIHYLCEECELSQDNCYNQIMGFKSLEDCRNHIKEYLISKQGTEEQYVEGKKMEYLNSVIDTTTFEDIEKEAQKLYKCQMESIEKQLKDNGLTLDAMVTTYGYESEQAFRDTVLNNSKDQLRMLIVLEAMGEKEGIKLSDAEYEAFAKKEVAGVSDIEVEKLTDEKFKEYASEYDKNYGSGMFKRYVNSIYVLDKCFEKYAKEVEAEAPATEAAKTSAE